MIIIQTSGHTRTSLVVWFFSTSCDSDWTNEKAVVEPLLSSDVSPPKFDNVPLQQHSQGWIENNFTPLFPHKPPFFSPSQLEISLLRLLNLMWRDNRVQ